MIVGEPLVQLLKNIRRAEVAYPDHNWSDALAEGQLRSKTWLINALAAVAPNLGTVFVVGGWVGILPALMFCDERLHIDKVRSFDIDDTCWSAAELVNCNELIANWRFKATTDDMFRLDYSSSTYTTYLPNGTAVPMHERPTTVINTSCDHIAPFSSWWNRVPSGTLAVLQNNDFKDGGDDHVNTVDSLAAFREMAPMSRELYAGTIDLQKYRRFMLIGRR